VGRGGAARGGAPAAGPPPPPPGGAEGGLSLGINVRRLLCCQFSRIIQFLSLAASRASFTLEFGAPQRDSPKPFDYWVHPQHLTIFVRCCERPPRPGAASSFSGGTVQNYLAVRWIAEVLAHNVYTLPETSCASPWLAGSISTINPTQFAVPSFVSLPPCSKSSFPYSLTTSSQRLQL